MCIYYFLCIEACKVLQLHSVDCGCSAQAPAGYYSSHRYGPSVTGLEKVLVDYKRGDATSFVLH